MADMNRSLAVVVTAACVALGACSRSTPDPTASPQGATATAQQPTAAAPPPSPAVVIGHLKASGIPIQGEITYTDATDTNNLLGRPHQYIGKAVWRDGRVKETGDPGLDTGGTVEVFANTDDCTARAQYVAGIARTPMFAEYDYTHGSVLVRVSQKLIPSQAREYEKALATLK
jgi:hypothetical protein